MGPVKILVILVVLAVAALVIVKGRQRLHQPRMADVGTTPRHSFDRPLLNGRGVRSLRDLRGLPTLVEFWAVG